MSTVLVIDDELLFLKAIAAIMQAGGYSPVCARSGEEASELLRRAKPELILLDLTMPGIGGMGFLADLRRTDRATPVILLTSVSDRHRLLEAARLGVQGCLLKPTLSVRELLERASALVQRQQAGGTASAAPAGIEAAHGTATPDAPVGSSAAAADDEPMAGTVETVAADEPTAASLLSQLKPLVTRTQITQQLDQCAELRAMSPTVAQILKMTGSAQCSIEQVARLIKQDHAIALKILKLANSTVYTRGEPVESVQKAVMRIGLTQIRQAVLNISVVEQFSGQSYGGLSAMDFWEHSIACGLIAAELTRSRGGKEAEVESAFTMGLLHDVGRLVYAEQLGDVYGRVLQVARDLRLPLEQAETKLLLVNHADAMDRILHAWRFPKHLVNPIAFHHLSMANLRHMARSMVAEVATLALANRLAHALLLGESANGAVYPTEEFVHALDVPVDVLRRIEEQVPNATSDMRLVMLSHGAEGPTVPLRRRLREQVGRPIRSLYVSAEPERDGYRLLFDRLRAEGDEPPNLGVVHLRTPRERASLTAQFQQAENEHEREALPLLVLSPKAQLRLDEAAMARRRVHLLPTPVTLAQLTAALGQLVRTTDGSNDKAAVTCR